MEILCVIVKSWIIKKFHLKNNNYFDIETYVFIKEKFLKKSKKT